MGRKRTSPPSVLFGWVRKQSMKVKIFLGILLVLSALVALKFTIEDHMHYFLASDAVHIVGIVVLLYQLVTHKTCSEPEHREQLTTFSIRVVEAGTLFYAMKNIPIVESYILERQDKTQEEKEEKRLRFGKKLVKYNYEF